MSEDIGKVLNGDVQVKRRHLNITECHGNESNDGIGIIFPPLATLFDAFRLQYISYSYLPSDGNKPSF